MRLLIRSCACVFVIDDFSLDASFSATVELTQYVALAAVKMCWICEPVLVQLFELPLLLFVAHQALDVV